MTSQLKLICVLAHPDKFLKAMEVGRNLDFYLLVEPCCYPYFSTHSCHYS